MSDDDDLYAVVRTEFEPVRLRADLDDITARGRTLRRRRNAGVAASLAVVAAVASVAVTVSTGAKTDRPAPMNLAAWSVEPSPDGSVVLTIRQLTDAGRLNAALRAVGVPALVEFERVPADAKLVGCAENDQPALPELNSVMPIGAAQYRGGEHVFPIRRDRMPAGTTLHFVLFEERSDRGVPTISVRTGLVKGTPLPCEPLWRSGK
ncbi:hypothetical protein [Actinoplanes sp. M2I2]|uniref:hypothetical protein n=1 Tax=Actinoplanes sp. M2I2 TaxID=1734444 RepID=UPI002020EE86|nr:hypothetical protein [Actinoplanes sp. M2I2]